MRVWGNGLGFRVWGLVSIGNQYSWSTEAVFQSNPMMSRFSVLAYWV